MKSILVLGYGNVVRTDDGAGVRIAEEMERRQLKGVTVRTTQQLGPEMVEEFLDHDEVILCDVSEQDPGILITEVDGHYPGPAASTHHFTPGLFVELMNRLYENKKKTRLYVCAVKGESFDYGVGLSPETWERVRQAVHMIESMILGEKVHA